MFLLVLALTVIAGGCPASAPPSPTIALYPVLRVVDGDTLVVDSKGGELTIRLREVNTPERGECGATEAQLLVQELARDGVSLEPSGRDQYGRVLAHAFTADRRHIGVELAHAGLAHVASYGRADEHFGALKEAEDDARRGRRGLYGGDIGCSNRSNTPQPGGLELVAIDANPEGDDLAADGGESVTLRGPPGHALVGWTIKDTSASHRYHFPDDAVIPADGVVRLYTGIGESRAGTYFWGMKGSAVWNNGGDTAFLLSPGGAIVHWLDYEPGGSASKGRP